MSRRRRFYAALLTVPLSLGVAPKAKAQNVDDGLKTVNSVVTRFSDAALRACIAHFDSNYLPNPVGTPLGSGNLAAFENISCSRTEGIDLKDAYGAPLADVQTCHFFSGDPVENGQQVRTSFIQLQRGAMIDASFDRINPVNEGGRLSTQFGAADFRAGNNGTFLFDQAKQVYLLGRNAIALRSPFIVLTESGIIRDSGPGETAPAFPLPATPDFDRMIGRVHSALTACRLEKSIS